MKAIGTKVNGTIVWSSSRDRQPRPVHDEDRRLGREADHERRAGRLVSALFAGRLEDPVLPQQEGLGQRARRQRQRQVGHLHDQPRRLRARRRWSTAPAGGAGSAPTRSSSCAAPKIFRTQARIGRRGRARWTAPASQTLDGALLQQPEMSQATASTSPSRCAAPSARPGSGTSTKKTWTQTGLGCQINWTPGRQLDLLGESDRQRRQRSPAACPSRTASPPKDMSTTTS